jgi:peptidoglycan/xylan/chitin deacetylase (PgdA/CDA1 family)
VSFVLNYEEGGERNVLDGDGTSEPYLWEKGPSGGGREHRHLNSEQDFEYGSRCGAWRIHRLMKEFGWNMTLWAIAVAMERNPTFAKACVRDGHEIGAHGYRWLDIWDYSFEDDKAYIKKSCLALEAATGEFPVGAYFGRGTPNTANLLPIVWKEMGHKMLYTSEVYNEDSPYWIDPAFEKDFPEKDKEGLLMLPYNYDCTYHCSHLCLCSQKPNDTTRQRWEIPHVARIRQLRWQHLLRVPQGHFRLSLSRGRQDDDDPSAFTDSREAWSLGKPEKIHAVHLRERTRVGGNSERHSKALSGDVSIPSRIEDRRQMSHALSGLLLHTV